MAKPRRSKTVTRPWDAAQHIRNARDAAAYLRAALDDGDPALVAAAIGDIARARGMAAIARETGLGRESLYKAFSANGNPEFATVVRVLHALGLTLKAVPIPEADAAQSHPRSARARRPTRESARTAVR